MLSLEIAFMPKAAKLSENAHCPHYYWTMHMVRKDEAELAGSACDCKNGNDSSKHIEDTC